MKASGQDERTDARPLAGRRRGTGARRAVAPALAAWLALVLCLVLVACGGTSTAGPQGGAATPTGAGAGATPNGGQSGGGTPSGQAGQGATPTPFGEGTPNAVLGANDACAQKGTPTASLPSTIPAYPNAQLHIGSVQGKAGVFGLCSSDSVDAINTYYQDQLPAHGWQKVTDETLSPSSRQLTGTQSNTNLIVTILPSSVGQTDILIIYSGS